MPREGIMLCYPFEKRRFEEKWGSAAYIQPKLDGSRCRALRTEHGIDLISSEGNRIMSVPHINKQLQEMNIQDRELDGELYIHGVPFEEIESIVKRTVNQHSNYQEMEYHIFDVVDEELNQYDRLRKVYRIADLMNKNTSNIKIVRHRIVESMEDIDNILEGYLEEGYEGFVLRRLDNLYKRTRSTDMMKFKPKKFDIYKIIGYKQEMTTHKEFKDSLGALMLDAGYGDGTTFEVGSGFTRDQRQELWKMKETLLGLYCRVGYQALTDKRGVPRFPVFIDIETIQKEE